MSKAQGDGYRTHTNTDLNAYRKRLNAKLDKMAEKTSKWYDNGDGFWVLAESRNVLRNPNGDWKWSGWEVTGKEYMVAVFPEEILVINDGTVVDVNGLSVAQQVFSDRNEALAFFRACRA